MSLLQCRIDNTRSRDNEELIRFIANSSKEPGKDASWHITRLIVQILLPLIIWLIIRYSISMKSWGDSLSLILTSRYIYSSIFSNMVYQGNTGSSHTKRMYRHTNNKNTHTSLLKRYITNVNLHSISSLMSKNTEEISLTDITLEEFSCYLDCTVEELPPWINAVNVLEEKCMSVTL